MITKNEEKNVITRQKSRILLGLFFFCMFTILDSIYSYYLQLDLSLFTHILYNFFYSFVFAVIITKCKERSNMLGTIVFLCIALFTVAIYTGEAIHFKLMKTFVLWEDLIRAKELTGVMGDVWKMIPVQSIVFILPLLIVVLFVSYFSKRSIAKDYGASTKVWKKTILLLMASAVFLVGTNVLLVYAVKDYNKQSLRNSKTYIQKYGVMDAVLYNTLQFFVLNRIVRDADAIEIKEAKAAFDYTPETHALTNKYKGKNLVFITGESVAPYGITEEFTPTLYQLREEAYNFPNYYSVRPNTFNSEFATLTSFYLTPDKERMPFTEIAADSMPGLFKQVGYRANAFHNFKGEFYNRTEKFIEIGFDSFMDAEDLHIPIEFEIFAHSDETLFRESLQYIPEDQPFFHYYLTVTSHGYYRSEDRYADSVPTVKTKIQEVQQAYPDLDDNAQTYIASVGVTDDGVAALMESLEATGKLADTVIVFVGDHYPYMMGDELISPIFGVENLELYKVPYFIWDATKPSQEIGTYTSNIDILPTLATLFDLPLQYAMGIDVFSSQIDKIILEWYDYRGYSFLTQDGGYDANNDIYYGDYDAEDVERYLETMMEREHLGQLQFMLYTV